MAEKMDMSLDDIIKKEKITGRRPRPEGSERKAGGGPQRRGRGNQGGSSRFSGRSRTAPYSKGPGTGKWTHDRFEGKASGGSGHLVVSNLDYAVNDKDIRELFSEFGNLKKAAVHYDKSGRSQGTADVVFDNRAAAAKALKQYNGVPLDGRPMRIELAGLAPELAVSATQRVGSRPSGQQRGGNKTGGRNPRQAKKPVTQEELDAELDAFVSKS